jgi:hypothetical protein
MSFIEEGFLAAGPLTGEAPNAAHRDWDDFGRALNRVAQALLMKPMEFENPRARDDYRVIGVLLFTRCISNFQGALLLAERGMLVEANTLSRSLIEGALMLAGIAREKNGFADKMRAADEHQQKSTTQWTLKEFASDFSPEQHGVAVEKLRRLAESAMKAKKLNVTDVVETTELQVLYAMYQELSHLYAHPSLPALSHFVEQTPGNPSARLTWSAGYGQAKLPQALQFLCLEMLGACVAFVEIIPDTSDGKLFDLYVGYQQLTETYPLKMPGA